MDKEKTISALPSYPGIYLFKDKLNQIIYIGKAKSIKKRVQSYFHNKDKDWKILSLIQEHTSIDYIITKNEEEALLLEAQLVKEHQPKFNVLLKSGQPFLYLLFSDEKISKLKLVRNKKQKGTYFGPFLNKKQARSLFDYVTKTFKLSWCKHTIEAGCLNFHIGICAGNCRPNFDEQEYLLRITLAQQLLKKEYKQAFKQLQERMHEHNKNLEFEKAKHVYEYIENFTNINEALTAKLERYAPAIIDTTITYKEEHFDETLATQLQHFLGTQKPIITIDCFDISHFQSSALVGSCVRFSNGKPDKNYCRRFSIRTLTEQNDYAALQEIVKRRYKNNDELPDLILIDGGKGQLNAIKMLGYPTPIISLAKKEERLFTNNVTEGIVLDVATPIGKLFIALRDYAHHFAINYHRLKRKKLNEV